MSHVSDDGVPRKWEITPHERHELVVYNIKLLYERLQHIYTLNLGNRHSSRDPWAITIQMNIPIFFVEDQFILMKGNPPK